MNNPYGFHKIYDINLTELNIAKNYLFFYTILYISGVRGEHLALLLDTAEHDCRTRRDDTGGEGPGAAEETLEVDSPIVTYDWSSHHLVNKSFSAEDFFKTKNTVARL